MFLVLVAIIALVSLPASSASQGDNVTLPLIYSANTVADSEQECGPDGLHQLLQVTRQEISSLIRNNLPALAPCNAGRGTTQNNPADSCSDLFYACPSDYYWIQRSNGSTVQVYCDTDRVFNGARGWTRAVYLNMTNESEQCPSAWTLQTRSSEPRRLCGLTDTGPGCESAIYSTFGLNYSQVCGRVIGYQYSTPDAFLVVGDVQSLEGYYVDGVSITHGSPGARQHIWTFAAGLGEQYLTACPHCTCPCASRSDPLSLVPSYIGNNYFCESGNPGPEFPNGQFYPSDPLWDGEGCGTSTCCELGYPPGVTPPWFCTQLPQATTDDLEIRLCRDQDVDEDTPIELIEVYIQ